MNQIEILHNKGMLAINMPEGSLREKTVIVIGAARGGTSMVAGVLHHLGVSMGKELSVVYEDVALSQAVEQNQIGDIVSLIAHNNDAHALWGWKRPSSIKHIAAWEGRFRNPYYIVIFRDLFAIANRNRISMLNDVTDSMREAARQFTLILDFIEKVKGPTLLVSYEKAMNDPSHFTHTLSNFIGLNDKNAIDRAIAFIEPNPEAYLKASRITDTKGVVDKAEGNIIAGWAMYPHAPQEIAKVRIRINDDLEFVVVADRSRPDLLDKQIHPTGNCGFLLTLPLENSLMTADIVSVRVVGDIRDLRKSPMTILGQSSDR